MCLRLCPITTLEHLKKDQLRRPPQSLTLAAPKAEQVPSSGD
jgi:hypothetical protein